MSDLLAALGDNWAAPTWEPLVHQPDRACRDCGREAYSWSHGCGGADRAGLYVLCDDCAALDGRGQRHDGHDDCSRWGIRTDQVDADRLTRLQQTRRATWLRRHRSA